MPALEVMMILLIGNRPARNSNSHRWAFTLIELILVMTILLVVIGVAAPTLSRFFKGRNLDSEARRILSLTKYGQSRAVSEGIPIVLWIDAPQKTYGLREASGYDSIDQKAVEFALDENLQIDPMLPVLQTGVRADQSAIRLIGNVPMIRFGPDGSIADTSPDRILLTQKQSKDSLWLVRSANRLRYEIQTPDVYAQTGWQQTR
jgi:Tfp pilus assembly protein FimT